MKDKLGRLLLRRRIQVVLPHITGRLLDIGCGTNELVRSYKGEGLGLDVHQWGDVDLVLDDSAHLPFRNEEIDTVTVIAALNHIPKRSEVLKEAHRVLTPEGKIIITMIPPIISCIWHFLRQPWDADQKERGMKEGEVYGLTGKEIHVLLEEAGFVVLCEQMFMLGANRLTVAGKAARE